MPSPSSDECPPKRQRVETRRFLDLEAAVDHDYDTDDEPVESDEDFINDGVDEEVEDGRDYRRHLELQHQLLVELERQDPHQELRDSPPQPAPSEIPGDTPAPELDSSFAEWPELDSQFAELREHIDIRALRGRQPLSPSPPPSYEPFNFLLDHYITGWELWGEPVISGTTQFEDVEHRLPKANERLFRVSCRVSDL